MPGEARYLPSGPREASHEGPWVDLRGKPELQGGTEGCRCDATRSGLRAGCVLRGSWLAGFGNEAERDFGQKT